MSSEKEERESVEKFKKPPASEPKRSEEEPKRPIAEPKSEEHREEEGD